MLFRLLPQSGYCPAMNDGILTIGEAAKRLGLSTQRIRQLERAGVLQARRTESGVRIFARAVVDEFRRKREAQRRPVR